MASFLGDNPHTLKEQFVGELAGIRKEYANYCEKCNQTGDQFLISSYQQEFEEYLDIVHETWQEKLPEIEDYDEEDLYGPRYFPRF